MVVLAATRRALVEHAEAEAPNEACGLVVIENDVAVRYEPGVNAARHRRIGSTCRCRIPRSGSSRTTGHELGIFHSHLSSPPRPSRTDVENIGLWQGRPYLIYTVRTGELAAWRIESGEIEPVPVLDR